MEKLCKRNLISALVALPLLAAAATGSAAQFGPVKLSVSLVRAPQHVFSATETMPAKPGPMTLYFPKYIPGEHGPTGPINGLAGLKVTADGKTIAWRRDPVDMYTFYIDVPAGAHEIQLRYDFLSPVGGGRFTEGVSTTPVLADLEWNQVVLYPAGYPSRDILYDPTLKVPNGWHFATALVEQSRTGDTITFDPVTLNNLIDSPVITGRYFKQYNLAPGDKVHRYLDIVAQFPKAAELQPDVLQHYRNLIVQAQRLFHSHHYTNYHFLLTLSNTVSHFGLEHHQSSDDRVGADTFLSKTDTMLAADLLPHEYTHSWNGKFRRPAKLWQPNFQRPEHTRMLWVYEGLTEYWGPVLAARSDLFSRADFRQRLALEAANLNVEPGRTWRPLIDTTTAAQLLYASPYFYHNWRRGTDFYDEGTLIWLDVDTLIRKLTHDRKSLDNFAREFYGIDNGSYVTKTFTFKDIVAGLNKVVPYHWASMLRHLLDDTSTHAPLAGITRGGWKLAYSSTPNGWEKAEVSGRHTLIAPWFTLGLRVSDKGHVKDVLWHGPAFQANMAPGMTIIGVDGEKFSAAALKRAIEDSASNENSVNLTVKNQGRVETFSVAYHGGLRYPRLVRVAGTPDYLDQILDARKS